MATVFAILLLGKEIQVNSPHIAAPHIILVFSFHNIFLFDGLQDVGFVLSCLLSILAEGRGGGNFDISRRTSCELIDAPSKILSPSYLQPPGFFFFVLALPTSCQTEK